jgi:glycosyltransferase involved in cell wall biosynthesis
MKLLMISGDRAMAAGKQGAFYNTLQELHKHFERIDVICPRAKAASYELTVFDKVHIHPSRWPLFLQWLWIWRAGKRIVREQKPSLATVHEYPPFYNGLGAWLLHRSTGLTYILEVMHVPGYPRAAGLRERFYRWLTKFFIAADARSAAAVRVINQHELPDFLVAAGVPKTKLLYAPAFYIDLDIFKPQPVDKQYDIAFVGRLARNKGLDIFLDVVRQAGLVAVVVGEGPLSSWARRRAKQLGLKINFTGFARDSAEVASLINRSRLLLMTSLNEGGPRVVLEALACGVPVVATPVGIVPDVLPPECIEEWNAADLAAKVKNILADAELYSRIRETGLFAVKRFEKVAAITEYAMTLEKMAK